MRYLTSITYDSRRKKITEKEEGSFRPGSSGKQGSPTSFLIHHYVMALCNGHQITQIIRCIHVAILCIQDCPMCRPTMLDVLFWCYPARASSWVVPRGAAQNCTSSSHVDVHIWVHICKTICRTIFYILHPTVFWNGWQEICPFIWLQTPTPVREDTPRQRTPQHLT